MDDVDENCLRSAGRLEAECASLRLLLEQALAREAALKYSNAEERTALREITQVRSKLAAAMQENMTLKARIQTLELTLESIAQPIRKYIEANKAILDGVVYSGPLVDAINTLLPNIARRAEAVLKNDE